MSLRIQNNIAAFDAERNLNATSTRLQQSMARLSSGYRINTAADDAAGLAISEIDAAIDGVSSLRANYGAVQNRLEHVANNLGVYQENLTASESQIRDVDMASEMVEFTKDQILQQAGTSMLSQANQLPNSVLSLLR